MSGLESGVNAVNINEFVQTKMAINRGDGAFQVPAMTHWSMPGLVVTMYPFGTFSVTHMNSGLCFGPSYERMGNALLIAAELTAIAKDNNFSWADLDRESVAEKVGAIGDMPVPFKEGMAEKKDGASPMTVSEWLRIITKPELNVAAEFPLEESNPTDKALALLGALVRTPGPQSQGAA